MGGKTTIQQPAAPTAPSPAETSREAINAQIDALPRILQAQEQYGPQFSQQQLDALQQFGPEFAQTALELQKQFAPQFQEVERQVNPELAAASSTLADFLQSTDEQEFQRLLPGLTEDVRAAQSLRGLGDVSPLGAIDEAVQVQRLRQSLKDRRLNVALSTAGRTPISGLPTVQGQTGTNQLVQNISPESIFGAQSSINALNSSVYQTASSAFANQPGSILGQVAGGLGGSLVGGIGSSLGTGLGTAALGLI